MKENHAGALAMGLGLRLKCTEGMKYGVYRCV